MASFNDTVELERSLLNLLTSSRTLLRQFHSRVREEFFTSQERKFIWHCADRIFKDTQGPLTQTVFEYEVKARIDDKEAQYYLSEWGLVRGITVTDDGEVIIEKLHEAQVGRKTLDAAEAVAELLGKGDVVGAVRQLKRSACTIQERRAASPIVEVTDYKRRLKVIEDKKVNPEKYLGIKTGFHTFDIRTGGLFPGELTVISAVTGVGKSTFMKQIAKGIVMCNVNKNVLHIANEENQLQVETKYDANLTGIPYLRFKLARDITDEDIEKWKTVMEFEMKKPGRGRLFVREVPAFTDATLVEETVRELEHQGIPIHVVIIDHMPNMKPIEQVFSEWDQQGKTAADCKELARSLMVPVVTAGQGATVLEEKQSKGRRGGKLDVYGSKEQIHVANTFIIITLAGTDDSDPNVPEHERDAFWNCDVKKNRDGACFLFKAKHHVRYGYVEEVVEKTTAVAKDTSDAIEKALKEDEKLKEVQQIVTAPAPSPAPAPVPLEPPKEQPKEEVPEPAKEEPPKEEAPAAPNSALFLLRRRAATKIQG